MTNINTIEHVIQKGNKLADELRQFVAEAEESGSHLADVRELIHEWEATTKQHQEINNG